jgi:uncharacterized protein with GYD domain
MPTYILLSTLTPEGRRTLHSDPDRLDEVNQEITDFGCEVVAQYAVLGDRVLIKRSIRNPFITRFCCPQARDEARRAPEP